MLKIVPITLKIFKVIITVTLAILLFSNIYIAALKKITGSISADFLGYSAAVVASGSMEPEISVDDIIVIRKQEDYKKGDIITFQKDNILVTHRIDEKLQNSFITKGDANNVPDTKEVAISDVVGRTLFVIPKAGKIIFYLRTPLGMALIIFAGFLLFEMPILLNKKYEQGGEKIEI